MLKKTLGSTILAAMMLAVPGNHLLAEEAAAAADAPAAEAPAAEAPKEEAPKATIEQVRSMLQNIPYVAAEADGDRIFLRGWYRDDMDKAILTRVVGEGAHIVDLTMSQLPTRDRMIEVDVIIVVVNDTQSRSIGFDFLQLINMQYQFFTTHHRQGTEGFLGPGRQGPLAGTQWQSGGMLSASVNYNVNIANATDESVNIVARPHLTTLNSEKATFLSGGQIIFKVTGINSGDIKPFDFGISLDITPTVLPKLEGEEVENVIMHIEASRLSVLGRLLASENNEDVNFDKTLVKSKAVLPLNETLVLSGLYQREFRKRRSGTPILRDIPVINLFFSNRTTIDDTQSTVIFITPRDPNVVNSSMQDNIEKFIERRQAYMSAVSEQDKTVKGEKIAKFKQDHPNWFKPARNSMATHFFMRENSEVYRGLRGDDLRVEDLERGVMAVDSATSARKKREAEEAPKLPPVGVPDMGLPSGLPFGGSRQEEAPATTPAETTE